MFDHFSIVAPIYECLIPPPDPEILRELAQLTSESVVLDAAGGTGRVATLYASEVRRIVVCDASAGMLKEAQSKGLEAVQAAIEELPFKDEEFDVIFLVDALHHLQNQCKALKELLRVLKPTGTLIIEEPDIRYPLIKIIAFLEKLFLMRSHFVPVKIISQWVTDTGGNSTIRHQNKFRVWLAVTKS